MSVGGLLALVCIILGFIVGVSDNKIVFDALSWFVAAIAIVMTLGGVAFGGISFKKGE